MKTLTRIFYVEDEPDIQHVVRLVLENLGGFDVMICSDGEQALKVVEDFLPDMIILDVMLPGMDGPSVFESMRSMPTLAQVPFVFMTAKAQTKDIDYLKSLGACDVVTKPFDPLTLVNQINAIWTRCSK